MEPPRDPQQNPQHLGQIAVELDAPDPDLEHAEPSVAWQRFQAVTGFLYEVVAKIAIFVLLGCAALFIYPSIAASFFAFSGAVILARLVVKILNEYDNPRFNQMKDGILDFNANYPYLQVIVFLFAVLVSLLSPIAGAIIAGIDGVFGGVVMDYHVNRRNQDLDREKREVEADGSDTALAVL